MARQYQRVTKELIVGHKFGIDKVRIVMTGKQAEEFCVGLFKRVDSLKKRGRDNIIAIDIEGLLKAAV